ncbi:MAG: aminotransferase, partial [Gammaproteobacteria bacterium]|nr:aminotransferase [Gammaproteobacteria bacterium]
GCNQAFCAVLTALAGAGDEVLLATPYYFNHEMWLTMNGIQPRLVPCNPDDGLPEPAAFEAQIGPRTRAVVLVSPNNPTGAIYPPELLEQMAGLARRHGLALVLDETYRDFVDPAGPPHRLFSRGDWRDCLISLHSFSKSFSLTGYRVGAVVAGAEVLAAVEKFLDCAAICPTHVSQLCAQYALERLSEWRRQRCAQMRSRARAFAGMFDSNSLGYRLVSVGAFFAYVRHPFEGRPSLQVARDLAAEQNLLCLPGSMFGPGQDAFLRFSFTNVGEARFEELFERLRYSQTSSS